MLFADDLSLPSNERTRGFADRAKQAESIR